MSKAIKDYNVFELSIPKKYREQYYKSKVDVLEKEIKELEEQNEELLNIIIEIADVYNLKNLLKPTIEKITGKSIEEVLKDE